MMCRVVWVALQLKADEEALKQQLESIENERSHLHEQINTEKAEAKRLDDEEDRCDVHLFIRVLPTITSVCSGYLNLSFSEDVLVLTSFCGSDQGKVALGRKWSRVVIEYENNVRLCVACVKPQQKDLGGSKTFLSFVPGTGTSTTSTSVSCSSTRTHRRASTTSCATRRRSSTSSRKRTSSTPPSTSGQSSVVSVG